jgi:hypothetical protein
MRRVEQLITQIRRATENTRVGTADGLSDEEFVQYLNDAQEAIQAAILGEHATLFQVDKTYTVSGAESYTMPTDIYGGQAAVTVFWSPDGSNGSWVKLHQARAVERISAQGRPYQYIVRGNSFLLEPYPTSGYVRLTYNRQLRRLDKRRATVSSRALGGTSLTALTIGGSLFVQADYDLYPSLSVVDSQGVVLMSGVTYSAVSAPGVVSLDPTTFAAQTGETCPVGAYVCLGTNASPTSELPEIGEKLLLKMASRMILDRDSSNDRQTFKEDEMDMLRQIVSFYGDVTQDLDEIPVTNTEYFDDLD